MRPLRFLLACLIILLAAASLPAETVDVSEEWCDGGCSEGHNDTQCICTFKGWMSQSDPNAWVKCEEVPCCDWRAEWCDLGEPNGDPNECEPREVDGPYDPVTCFVETSRGTRWCEVPCGESGCYANYTVPNIEIINEEGPNYCTRSNESCDWWAPWTCFEPCTVDQQSPWDDGGSTPICG